MQPTDARDSGREARVPLRDEIPAERLPGRALLLVNRRSRAARHLDVGAMNILLRAGLEVAVRETDGEQDLRAAILAHRDRRIIIGGGDGTVNCALPALLEAGRPFGLLPLGTANDLARSLDIPNDPVGAMSIVAAGHVRRIDVARANDRYFVNAAHIGLAARITRNLSGSSKRSWGGLAYLAAALRSLRRHRTFHAVLRCDGATYLLHSIQITIGNGCRFGGGMVVSEDAALDDGLLDFYNIPPKGMLGLAVLAPYLRAGRHVRYEDIQSGKGRIIEVETRHRLRVTTDGEVSTRTPLRCEVQPGRLSVYAPPPTAGMA